MTTHAVTDTFCRPCLACGATVQVVAGVEQPHEHIAFRSWRELIASAWWNGFDHADRHAVSVQRATWLSATAERRLRTIWRVSRERNQARRRLTVVANRLERIRWATYEAGFTRLASELDAVIEEARRG